MRREGSLEGRRYGGREMSDISRQEEAYLTLIKDITELLGMNWHETPPAAVKEILSTAIAKSLEMWI